MTNEEKVLIEQVLEKQVRPQLRAHDGDVEALRLEDGVLHVRLLGQCAGCPSADLTNESILQAELTGALPEIVKQVVVEQGVSDELWDQAKRILRDHRA